MAHSKCMGESKAAHEREYKYAQKQVPTEVGYYWCRPFKSSTSSTVVNVGLVADNYDCYEDEYPDDLCIVTPQYDWMGLSDVYIWGPKIEEWVPDESVRS